jgi:molybdopterin molybdotransferase
VLVVCGGVSVGPHDHVKPAFAELGVQEVLWGVALRPGHPTWFGSHDGALVFGLPGNPVSAMVTFHLFVRPALDALAGAAERRRRVTAVMDEPYRKQPGRLHAVRCRLEARDDGWHVRPTKAQGSHVLTSMLGAEALALLEPERGDVAAGERVAIELLEP